MTLVRPADLRPGDVIAATRYRTEARYAATVTERPRPPAEGGVSVGVRWADGEEGRMAWNEAAKRPVVPVLNRKAEATGGLFD